MLEAIIGIRVLGAVLLVLLLAVLVYHSVMGSKARKWQKSSDYYKAMCESLDQDIANAQSELQRLRSKLNSAKSRIRRQRKSSRRRNNRDAS